MQINKLSNNRFIALTQLYTVLPPDSTRLRTWRTWNPNKKFEQILSQNPNAALESERPARSCVFVHTFPQRSGSHTCLSSPSLFVHHSVLMKFMIKFSCYTAPRGKSRFQESHFVLHLNPHQASHIGKETTFHGTGNVYPIQVQ